MSVPFDLRLRAIPYGLHITFVRDTKGTYCAPYCAPTTQIRAEQYLCRLIARLMGGDLRLDSDYKDGMRIILDIATK